MITHLHQFLSDGCTFKRASSKDGGEWQGPCPFCGEGKDRFSIWPHHPAGKGGRFSCRRCERRGDGIDFLRSMHQMGFHEACTVLNVAPPYRRDDDVRRPSGGVWTPRPRGEVSQLWQEQATRLAEECAAKMTPGSAGMEYARSRGFTAETVHALGLGWIPSDRWQERSAWGLPSENNMLGKPRKVWLPAGLVIPVRRKAGIVGIKVRRVGPGIGTAPDAKYIPVSGSVPIMVLPGGEDRAVIVVESELDAALIWQEARDLTAAIALGTACGKPDASVWAYLHKKAAVRIALDNDPAGASALSWWQKHLSNARVAGFPGAKDVGDLAADGGVRQWVKEALSDNPPQSATRAVRRIVVTQDNLADMPPSVRLVWQTFCQV